MLKIVEQSGKGIILMNPQPQNPEVCDLRSYLQKLVGFYILGGLEWHKICDIDGQWFPRAQAVR